MREVRMGGTYNRGENGNHVGSNVEISKSTQ